MKKKLASLVIIALLVMTFNVSGIEFSDVPVGSVYYEAVIRLGNEGIIKGRDDGSFGLYDRITRAEFCALISRADGYTEKSEITMPFKDVDSGDWAEGYISYCYEKGYVNGVSDTRFEPDENITYEQAIKIVVCVSGAGDEALSLVGPEWYSGYMSVAKEKGFLNKVGYEIGKPASRAFVAQVIYNAIYKDREFSNTNREESLDYEIWDETLNYERQEYIPEQEEDMEQKLRDQLGLTEEENDKPRYDENSERNMGR